MTLSEFLSLIADEDVRIELRIEDNKGEDYTSFWLSDFREGNGESVEYKEWKVLGFDFYPNDYAARISIHITKSE